MKHPVIFQADFCRQLATTLDRFSTGKARDIGTHIAIDGEIWYCHLRPAHIYEIAYAHQGLADAPLVLEAQRGAQSVDLRLEHADVLAILFVCNKVLSGAASVPLIGNIEVGPRSVPNPPAFPRTIETEPSLARADAP